MMARATPTLKNNSSLSVECVITGHHVYKGHGTRIKEKN